MTTGEFFRAPLAGFLGWIVPGLGHIYLGHRTRGLVCLVTITATFWSGIAIGGVGTTIEPRERTLWFTAQMFAGANAMASLAFHQAVVKNWNHRDRANALARWTSTEVGIHYTGVAGLLNLLVILDALTRSEKRTIAPPVPARHDELRGVT